MRTLTICHARRAAWACLGVLLAASAAACSSGPHSNPGHAQHRSPASPPGLAAPGGNLGGPGVSELSYGCSGRNAESEQAVQGRYVYEEWIGCGGIGFARSANGGLSFDQPVRVPGSAGSGYYRNGPGGAGGLPKYGWDPSVAVAPDGTVYVAYMMVTHGDAHPIIAVSTDHGATFAAVHAALPPAGHDFGDRDFIAVGPTGTIYLTWDYCPNINQRYGNIVFQRSTDGGRTWSPVKPISPGYPNHGGAVAAPLLVEPDGRIDVLFWVLAGAVPANPALPLGHVYFTSSDDGGRSWSAPVGVQPGAGRIGNLVTWIDTDLARDAGGTLYATWDTQSPGGDVGWLSYSTDHGQTWSPAIRVTPDRDKAEHIMAVTGGRPGIAYLAWLSDNSRRGFAQYLRPFSVRSGWLAAPILVSKKFGQRAVWPGDTIGISVLPASTVKLILSWGSAVSNGVSQIWASIATPAGRR